jgi:predicted outer membrane protein
MENFKAYIIGIMMSCIIIWYSKSSSTPATEEVTYLSKRPSDTLSVPQFIRQLSIFSAKEINLSKLARKKSKQPKVKEYAVKVIDAGILIYSDLKPMAEARSVTLVDSTTFVPGQLLSTLKKSGNTGFDRQYLSISIEDHNQAIGLLEKGAMFGDTALVSFASKQLAVVRTNLEEARFFSKSVGTRAQ